MQFIIIFIIINTMFPTIFFLETYLYKAVPSSDLFSQVVCE